MKHLVAILALSGMVVSALALREHYRTDTSPCSINERWDCGIVNHSPYATLGGIPVAVICIAGYCLLGVLALRRAYRSLLAAVMAGLLVTGVHTVLWLAMVFSLGGIFVGVQEALEDSLAAELVPAAQHGMAFGTLAAVNAIGDFASSVAIGLLWTSVSPSGAFAVGGILFLAGAILLRRLG